MAIVNADGAGYHTARQEETNFYSSSITIKNDLKPYIQQHPKIKTLKVDGKTYKRSDFFNGPNAKKKNPGPGLKGLQKGLIDWLEKNDPDALKTDFEKEMEKHGFKVIFNLPMHPEFNPIELNWALWKWCVRTCFFWNRSMGDLETHMLKSMNGGPPVKITKKVNLVNGEEGTIDHVCDCNPNGVPPEIQMKHIRHAVTEIQKLLIEKEGKGDILKRNNKDSKWRVETYHHMSFKQIKIQLSGSASELSSLPTGKQSEIIDDD